MTVIRPLVLFEWKSLWRTNGINACESGTTHKTGQSCWSHWDAEQLTDAWSQRCGWAFDLESYNKHHLHSLLGPPLTLQRCVPKLFCCVFFFFFSFRTAVPMYALQPPGFQWGRSQTWIFFFSLYSVSCICRLRAPNRDVRAVMVQDEHKYCYTSTSQMSHSPFNQQKMHFFMFSTILLKTVVFFLYNFYQVEESFTQILQCCYCWRQCQRSSAYVQLHSSCFVSCTVKLKARVCVGSSLLDKFSNSQISKSAKRNRRSKGQNQFKTPLSTATPPQKKKMPWVVNLICI